MRATNEVISYCEVLSKQSQYWQNLYNFFKDSEHIYFIKQATRPHYLIV